MTNDQKLNTIVLMLGGDAELYDTDVLRVYLNQAKEKILNKRYPFGTDLVDVESKYEQLQLELTISLYNQRGAEGEKAHSENSVSRSYRTPSEILEEIPSMVGIPV